MPGSFTITGLSATEPAGERQFGPLSIQGSAVIGETIEAPLKSGDNTFSVPEQATACLIIPPLNGSAELKLRTSKNLLDEGVPLSQANPTVYSFPAAPLTSLVIHASVVTSGPITIAFI
jgi:hypothetical protein